MSRTIEDVNASEKAWIDGGIELALTLARRYNAALDKAELNPTVLDRTYAAWLANPGLDLEPNDVINAVGLAFGQYLVDRNGMRWVVYTEQGQTDIAVYRDEGEVIICPTNLVGKRYPERETNFLAPIYSGMAQALGQLAQPAKKAPWWKLRG